MPTSIKRVAVRTRDIPQILLPRLAEEVEIAHRAAVRDERGAGSGRGVDKRLQFPLLSLLLLLCLLWRLMVVADAADADADADATALVWTSVGLLLLLVLLLMLLGWLLLRG